MSHTLLSPALAVLCTFASVSVSAQSFFNPPRTFLAAEPCDATLSIRSNKDPVPLAAGQSYEALGENSPSNPTHAFIAVNGERRWVALDCGRYADTTKQPAITHARACPPFFDDQQNPVPVRRGMEDVTPPPPTLDDFDNAVNQLCGAPGSAVSRNGFRQLLETHPEVLEEIRDYTDGRIFAGRAAPEDWDAFLDDLSEAWFDAHGFEHIFCGELESDGDIGGLHFSGRYWQLQQDGLACRLDSDRAPEVDPGVIYTVGASIQGMGRIYEHPIKGYGYTLSARDILLAATRAFLQNPTDSGSSTACILNLRDDSEEFATVFVRRRQGIRTFYPDASPSRRDPTCQDTLQLP